VLRFGVRAVVVALALASAGWNYVEHVAIGKESYTAACQALAAELANAEPAVKIRLAIACDNLDIAAELYGQATALAGDRFGAPQDFLSTSAGWKAASRKQYLGLALGNSTHFHPYAPREWRRYHAEALKHALGAAATEGLDAVDGLQRALFESAFADHFLHDSFSSGHMGFNRAASSVAASLAYHDLWNRKGRVVRDRSGASWRTYGDGRLDHARNVMGRIHVIQVATLSIGAVLRGFVVGKRDAANELAIWRSLPFVIEAPDLPSLTDRIVGAPASQTTLHPLGAVNWPARKDRVVDVRFLVTGTTDGDSPITALLLGYHVSLPVIATRVHLGVGAGLPHGPRDLTFAFDVGFTSQLGLTNDGILEHQLGGGVLWELDYGPPGASLWGGYLVNIEIGRSLLQFQVGPAFLYPERQLGYAAAFGFARVLSAAGGGVR
jgi:hypothetical protein